MQIYLAARFSRRDELEALRPLFEAAGHTLISRWHQEQASAPLNGAMANHTPDENAFYAARDAKDVLHADMLVLFTEPPESAWPRGARHVEYGMAFAAGIQLSLVGPRENVFHWMLPATPVHSSVHELLNRLKESQ